MSRSRRRSGGRIVLASYCALVLFFLMLPLIVVFPISFSDDLYLRFPPSAYSFRWYDSFFGDPAWIGAAIRSLKVGLAAAALSLLLGVPLAFSLVRGRYPGKATLDKLITAPIIVPTIILSIAVYGLFANMKLIGEWYGIAVAHTILALPFVVIVVSASLRSLDESLEQAAIGLGAGRLQAVCLITLPQIKTSLISAGFLAFITSFDELVIAMFLSGSQMTLPKKMFDNIRMEIDPTVAAASVLQIVIVTVFILVWAAFNRGRSDNSLLVR